MKKIVLSCLITLLLVYGCSDSANDSFVYNGRLDTDLIRISSEVSGKIDSLTLKKGDAVRKDQALIRIDTERANVQLSRQNAQLKELEFNLKALQAQISQVKSKLDFARATLKKTQKMVEKGAATEQQRDELATNVDVLEAQLQAAKTNKGIISAKKEQIEAGIRLTQINIKKATLRSPVDGIIINKFRNQSELVSPGMVIAEVADLSNLEATIYVPLTDLDDLKLGRQVEVKIDGSDKVFAGKILWIASEAEFTPKTILTKETRETLVYAVKVSVENKNGELKIGMPVDVVL